MAEHETTNFHLPYPGAIGKVKLGAKDIEELAKSVDKVFTERLLTYKGYSASATLKSGELAVQGKSGETFTLPAAVVNAQIGIFCGAAATSAKVTTSGGALIFGDSLNGVGTITLTSLQHVVLTSDGTNWLIVAGEVGQSWGLITSAGATTSGSGDYTSAKTGTGIFTITWITAKLSANYAVVASTNGGGVGGPFVSQVTGIEASKFSISTYKISTTEVKDVGFSFEAKGTG